MGEICVSTAKKVSSHPGTSLLKDLCERRKNQPVNQHNMDHKQIARRVNRLINLMMEKPLYFM